MRLAPLARCALFLLALVPMMPASADHDAGESHVLISEVLASASSESFNGTDWNGDGDIGQASDQFIELWNPTDATVDISNWILDDVAGGGSAPCRIGWNTTLEPDARLAVFRANTRIELDYWTGDSVRLLTEEGATVHEMSYGEQHSRYDVPYVWNPANGSFGQFWDGPSPGVAHPDDWTGAGLGGLCFTMSETRHEGEYILEGRIVTMTDESNVVDGGAVHVKDGNIERVYAAGEARPEGVQIIQTGGDIFPGLIDSHNHIHYNAVPIWQMDAHIGDTYTNRYQWRNHPDYKPEVTWPKTLLESSSYWGMEYDALKHAEMKAIVGGTTAVQGNPTGDDSAYTWVLARNVEHHNFGRDNMHTKVTELESDYVGNHIKTGSADGTLDAWFLHLSEGTDQSSLDEFQILVDNDLLVPELMLIHGVPLGAAEYAQIANVGATLVWSPTSNLLLYGQTADVAAAHAAGVSIALAPDWSPSGSKSPLHELKLADWLYTHRLGDIFTDFEQVQMVTTNAADGMNWQNDVGRIQAGLAADLLVIDRNNADPYRNLVEAIDPDVRLTVVGGLPIYGDVDIMTELKGTDHEIISWNGMQKAVDVTFMGVDEGERSWADIQADLTMALEFNPVDMYDHFGAADDMSYAEFEAWAANKWPNLDAVGLDPLFTWGDARYFDALNNSYAFNKIGPIDLWSAYYDRPAELNPGVQLPTSFERSAPPTISDEVAPTLTEDGYRSLSLDDGEAVYWPYNSTIGAGIPMAACTSNSTTDANAICGALLIQMSEPTTCWAERWVDNDGEPLTNPWVKLNEECTDATAWSDAHRGISESPLPPDGEAELVSRLDPGYGPGDAIAFPGVMCADDAIQWSRQPASGGGKDVYQDPTLAHWSCYDAMDVFAPQNETLPATGEPETPTTTPEAGGLGFTWWVILVASGLVSIGSLAVILALSREDAN